MAKQQAVSFSTRREAAVEGGGKPAKLEVCWVPEFNYGGGNYKPNAALRTTYHIEGMQKPWEDHWNMGPSEQFEVSKDGYSLRRIAGPSGLNKASAGFFFFDALQTALETSGLDIDEYVIEEDGTINIEPLDGLMVTLVNKDFTNVSGDTKEKKVIAGFVADAPTSKSKNGSKGSTSSKNGGGNVEAKTIKAIEKLLAEDSPIKKGDLANLLMQANKKDPDVKAMMELCFKDKFIADENRPWEFNSKRGTLVAVEEDDN
jgi:hypothetical protein